MKINDPVWLTAEIACSLLDYEPETGIFRWKSAPNNSIQPGSRAGQVVASGYRSIAIKRKGVLEHRLAWLIVKGSWPKDCIDHINRDKTDNRIENLRDVTQSQNMHNSRRTKLPASGADGLSYRDGLWSARICFQGKEIHLGSHEDEEVMRLARAIAKDRALKGLRPRGYSDRNYLVDADTGEVMVPA